MPIKRFSDEQIALALRQAEAGTTMVEIHRKLGVAEATFYRWKKVHAGMWVKNSRVAGGLSGPPAEVWGAAVSDGAGRGSWLRRWR